METRVEWVLCGDIYTNRGAVGYRQIPVNKIKHISLEREGRYKIEIEDYESFDEVETMQTMSSLDRKRYKEQTDKIRNMTTITLELKGLDSFFAKRKDLKEKHIGALMKLIQNKMY